MTGLITFSSVKPLFELETRPQIKPKLLTEPRLVMEPPAAVELAQHEDTQETGESLQHILPVLPVNPQLMFQPIGQPEEQPQPIRPPSPKREPAYSDQVRSCNDVSGKKRHLYFLWLFKIMTSIDIGKMINRWMHMFLFTSIILCSLQDLMAEVESVVEEFLADEVLDIAKAGAQYVSAALG